eukprot:TRINITY_DN3601_c0_g3_i2.p1 TRINITY_DN3601_c0_g3~~TRINITY_DN3601_c0_g3_i2.p1  ORF type:complete len:623 (-),score=95.12 TRINITY_DN3601_c0_g3_i2:166-2013(-)
MKGIQAALKAARVAHRTSCLTCSFKLLENSNFNGNNQNQQKFFHSNKFINQQISQEEQEQQQNIQILEKNNTNNKIEQEKFTVSAKKDNGDSDLEIELEGDEALNEGDEIQAKSDENDENGEISTDEIVPKVEIMSNRDIRSKLRENMSLEQFEQFVDQQIAQFDIDLRGTAVVKLAKMSLSNDAENRMRIVKLTEKLMDFEGESEGEDVSRLVKSGDRPYVNVLWALAKLQQLTGVMNKNKKVHDVFMQLVPSVAQNVNQLGSSQIVSVLWSLVKAGVGEPTTVMIFLNRYKEFTMVKPMDLGLLFWVIKKVGVYDQDLVKVLLQNTSRIISTMAENDIASICMYLKDFRHEDASFLEGVKNRIRSGRLKITKVENMIQVVAAFAEFGLVKDSTINNFFVECSKQLQFTEVEQVSKTLQYFALLEIPVNVSQNIFDKWYNNYCQSEDKLKQMEKHESSVLKQARDVYVTRGENLNLPESIIQSGLQHDLERSERSKDKRNRYCSDVAKVLEYYGLDFQVRVVENDLGVEVLLAIYKGQQQNRIAIQISNPSQYTATTPYRLLGSASAYLKQIQSGGWQVIVVPVHEYSELKDWEKKVQYVKSKLKCQYECFPFY